MGYRRRFAVSRIPTASLQAEQPAQTKKIAPGRKLMHMSLKLRPVVVVLASAAFSMPGASAQEAKLPQTLTFTAYDTGITELKDLKGKRVGFVVGAPSLNQNALASLAFGGVTKNDVKIVEFASFGAMWKGMINNDVDAAFASTITAQTKEVETSPRGL